MRVPINRLGKMGPQLSAAAMIAVSMAALNSGIAFAWPVFIEWGFPEVPFIHLLPALPAVVLGLLSWRKTPPSDPVLGILALVLLLGLTYVDATERHRGLLLAAGALAAAPVGSLLKTRKQLHFALGLFAAGTLAASLAVLIGAGIDVIVSGNRHFASGVNANQFGMQNAFASIAMAGLGMHAIRNKRITTAILCIIAAALGLILLAISGSRGAALSATPAILYFLLERKHFWRTALIGAAMFTTLFFLSFFAQAQSGRSPLQTTVERLSGSRDIQDLNGRIPIWLNIGRIVTSDTPTLLIGVGTGGAEKEIARSWRYNAASPWEEALTATESESGIARRSSHNSYLEWLLCYGAVGFLVAIAAIIRTLISARTLDSASGERIRFALIIFCMLAASSLVIYRTPFWIMLGATLFSLLGSSSQRSSYRTQSRFTHPGDGAIGTIARDLV